jgi:hypothetical protein
MKYLAIVLLTALLVLSAPLAIAGSNTVTVNVSAIILPLFEIGVSGPNGKDIDFGVIQKNPNGSITISSNDIVVTTQSNLGRPYRVTQELIAPLTNERGTPVPNDAMTVDARSQKGQAAVGQVVNTSASTLLESDAQGSSDTVTASYKLRVEPQQEAGQYNTRLVYSIVSV